MMVLLGCSAMAGAQEPASPEKPTAPPDVVLPPVLVTAPPPVSSSSQQLIPGKDFEVRPQGRPADVLRLIPGLIIGQHQGGGKAEQYLIRGFDADHGTDLAIFVDGLPVNLRSHAHGQGYADLHFLIPETVKAVDVLKGPYFPEYGDFDTAGVVNFVTRDYVEENTVQIAGGSFNTERYLALLSPTRDALKTFIAIEGYHSDGPYVHPTLYSRVNVFAKASADLAEDMKLSLWASHYRADWHGSGQIPERAVREGVISRFGSIDPTEGGVTQRTNLNLDYSWKPTENQRVAAHAYVTYYALSLFNDFTFFLNDPVLGDEINQRDRRFLAGFETQYEIKTRPLGIPVTTTGGFQYRIDTPHVVLANATQRHQTGPVPPPGLSSSLTTQRYQRSSSGRCAFHSRQTEFFGFSSRAPRRGRNCAPAGLIRRGGSPSRAHRP
jgi:outer membrane receptor protein involved in Fe transport